MKKSKNTQHQYYTETASLYDDMHVRENDEHFVALKHVISIMEMMGSSSILDVGCGTGRAIKYFLEKGIKARAIEPVPEMISQAIKKNEIPGELITQGVGESLPFNDFSFDAVCEFGVLHHVKKPNNIVREMMRVARKAVFLSDSNRFGQGPTFLRLIKLLLYKTHLWGVANSIKTGCKGYAFSKENGLAYSYSVFDSYDILVNWADRIILIPTRKEKAASWQHPLLTSSHVLLCAIKE